MLNVVFTRQKEHFEKNIPLFRSFGFNPILCSLIKVIEIDWDVSFSQILEKFSTYDWIIFTSANAVRIFIKKIQHFGFTLNVLQEKRIKICAIGPMTYKALADYALKADIIPKEYVLESMLESLIPHVKGKHILIPRAIGARDILLQELKIHGAFADVMPLYKTILDDSYVLEFQRIHLNSEQHHCITFTSSSTVHSYFMMYNKYIVPRITSARRHQERIKFATIGPITTQALQSYGIKSDIVAKEFTLYGLFESISNYYTSHK